MYRNHESRPSRLKNTLYSSTRHGHIALLVRLNELLWAKHVVGGPVLSEGPPTPRQPAGTSARPAYIYGPADTCLGLGIKAFPHVSLDAAQA